MRMLELDRCLALAQTCSPMMTLRPWSPPLMRQSEAHLCVWVFVLLTCPMTAYVHREIPQFRA